MSECELPQYYNWTEPVARKRHECCECNAPILKGEKHLRVNGCWENVPGTFRQHLLCAEACELVRDEGLNDDECLYFGGLFEFWNDSCGYFGRFEKVEARKKLWFYMLKIKRRERKVKEQA